MRADRTSRLLQYIRKHPGSTEYALRDHFYMSNYQVKQLAKQGILRFERVTAKSGDNGHNGRGIKVLYYVNECDNLDENQICCNPFQTVPFSMECPQDQKTCGGFIPKRGQV